MDAEALMAIQELSGWFCLNIRVLMKYGTLLNADENQVFASKSTHCAFNCIENAGDNYLSEHGPGWVAPVLRAHLQQESAVAALAVERVAYKLSPQIHANVGLGPFMAVMLCLHQYFSLERSGATLTAEILAGMYEATAGALQRSGQLALLRAIHQFGAFLVCARYWHRKKGGNARDFYGLISPGFAMYHMQYAPPDLESLWDADWGIIYATEVWNWRWALDLLSRGSASEAPAPRHLAVAGCASFEAHQDNPLYQRVHLRCAESGCDTTFCSSFHTDHNLSFEEAIRAGWFRPTTRSWKQAARCPEHGWPNG